MIHKTRGTEIRAKKNEIRAQYKERRAAIPAKEKQIRDEKICSLFLSSITYRYAKLLLMYAPTGDEIDIMPIARQALADGKAVAFPRCRPAECRMDYHFIQNEQELLPGAYGILEPDASLPLYDPKNDDPAYAHPVCIVPGLVFDTDGYRIGYGKGYYDRYLVDFSGVRIGAVYSDFVLPRLIRGRFDLAVDVLVTEKGVKAVAN